MEESSNGFILPLLSHIMPPTPPYCLHSIRPLNHQSQVCIFHEEWGSNALLVIQSGYVKRHPCNYPFKCHLIASMAIAKATFVQWEYTVTEENWFDFLSFGEGNFAWKKKENELIFLDRKDFNIL